MRKPSASPVAHVERTTSGAYRASVILCRATIACGVRCHASALAALAEARSMISAMLAPPADPAPTPEARAHAVLSFVSRVIKRAEPFLPQGATFSTFCALVDFAAACRVPEYLITAALS